MITIKEWAKKIEKEIYDSKGERGDWEYTGEAEGYHYEKTKENEHHQHAVIDEAGELIYFCEDDADEDTLFRIEPNEKELEGEGQD